MSLFEDYEIDGQHLKIDSSGRFVGGYGAGRVAQAVDIRINTSLGEWSFNEGIGVDWRGVILVKNPDFAAIRSELVNQITDVAGLDRVSSLELTLSNDRLLIVTWSGLTDQGIPIGGSTI